MELSIPTCLTVLTVLLCVSYQAHGCNFPPRFWCDSEEIARQCNVYQQCAQSVWENSHSLKFVSKFSPQEPSSAKPVEIGLYYESLCPDCRQLVSKMLNPTYQKVGGIMNITLVPYGNALEKKVGDHWEFECQHGKDECVGNLIETCAISVVGNFSAYFPFITCVESNDGPMEQVAKTCAAMYPVPIDQILECSKSSQGNQLEHQMAVITDQLQPQHKYVPWITLFGVHTEKIQDEASTNLLKLVCDSYKGPAPAACTQL